MSKRDWTLFAEDILESLELIESYMQSIEFAGFTQDRKTIDAVVRNFEIIGEASKNIPEDIKGKYSGVDWKGMVGLRNRIAHEYFGVSLEIVWNIIKQELPGLNGQIRRLLEEAGG